MADKTLIKEIDEYVKEIETKINNVIDLRTTLKSISSYEGFCSQKNNMIQLAFNIEDLLRNSVLFLKKRYFAEKNSKSKQINYSIPKQTDSISKYDTERVPIITKEESNLFPSYSYRNPINVPIIKEDKPSIDDKDVNEYIKSNTNTKEIKQKASRVADLVMKFNFDSEMNEMICQLFGEDVIDRLMSSEVTDDLIDRVEESVNEIERLREKDKKNNK